MWFIDKANSKAEWITVNRVREEFFAFNYKGKTINCPNNKIGNGIYKVEIFYMGELFFYNRGWKREDNSICSATYQKNLSKLFRKRLPFYKLTTSSLIDRAQKAKDSKKYDIAISYFEIALLKSTRYEMREYIAELSSVYRKYKKPHAVISLYKYICKNYEDFSFSSSFLNSLAGAYLDIGNKEKALRCAGEVYRRFGGQKDEKLENLYRRINTY